MDRTIKTHNLRFYLDKAPDREAWEHLHSDDVAHNFHSQNEFLIEAISDSYHRHIQKSADPYLETREKENAFADRIVDRVERKFLNNLPAILGQFFITERR